MDFRDATSSSLMYSSAWPLLMVALAVTWLTSLRGIPTTTCRILIISSFSASSIAARSGIDAFIGFAIMLALIPSDGVSL